MTSKLVVNTIEADTGISSVSFASSISMSSTSKFHFGNAGIDIGADTNINRPSAGVLGFNINSSEKVRITSNGNILVGKTDDAGKGLEIYASNNAALRVQNSHTGVGAGDGLLIEASFSDALIWNYENAAIRFATNNTERFRIASDGKFYFGNQTVLDPAFNNSVGLSGSGVLGFLSVCRNSDIPVVVGRTGSDGNLIRFFHAGSRDGVLNSDSGGIGLYGNNHLSLGTGNGTERLRFNSAGGVSISNTDSNAVHSMSNYDHGNLTYTHRNNRVLTSNGTGWDGNESTDGADPILILGVTDRAGNSDIGDAYGLCLHSESQDDNDYGPLIGWSNRSNSGNYNTTYAAIVGQKTGQSVDSNWSAGALHFFTQKTGYMDNVADLSIDSAGHVMMPRNSRFYALNNSGGADSQDGSTGKISDHFETELVDSNGDYNTGNGRFTAPVDGKYEFHFAALHRSLGYAGSGELTFYKNGSNLSVRSFGYSNIGSGGSTNDHQHLHIHGIFGLSAGDYIEVYIHSQSSGMDFYTYQGLGYFSGKLLG